MSLNAYIPQDNGNLKHVAEADATPDQLSEFMEAIQDELRGAQKDGPFVVIDIDNDFSAYVEYDTEEIVEVKRVLKIGGVTVNNGATVEAEGAPKRATRKAKAAPAKTATRTPAAKGTAKRTVKKAAAPKAGAKTIKRGSGFKRNAASAE
jgi:hypothetical protein